MSALFRKKTPQTRPKAQKFHAKFAPHKNKIHLTPRIFLNSHKNITKKFHILQILCYNFRPFRNFLALSAAFTSFRGLKVFLKAAQKPIIRHFGFSTKDSEKPISRSHGAKKRGIKFQ